MISLRPPLSARPPQICVSLIAAFLLSAAHAFAAEPQAIGPATPAEATAPARTTAPAGTAPAATGSKSVANSPQTAVASEQIPATAARGWELLTQKSYLPPDFDQAVFDQLWTIWPKPLREQAQNATAAERRQMTLSRYGLMPHPEHPDSGTALGHVSRNGSEWVMNCMSCHTGKVEGKVVLGSPNSHFALHSLVEDTRTIKLKMQRPLAHLELGSLAIPLGTTHGTTNAVIFGIALAAARDRDINFIGKTSNPPLHHHDCDAPPFWNVRKKKTLYADGFAAKSARPLLQFVMIPRNSGETIRGWEPDAQAWLAWIESLEPPQYTRPVDQPLAEEGRVAFARVCARCHGTYGAEETYPNKIIPLAEIGTDPERFLSLTPEYRSWMHQSWYGDYGKAKYNADTKGYQAPPLDGIWASAPYFHNGSVPTLWHLLHPDQRPKVWKRTENGYDHERMGLEIQTFEQLPENVSAGYERRQYFDTTRKGKSAAGHTYVNELSEDEKRAVLEYLKTL